jgi:hypothetical protein
MMEDSRITTILDQLKQAEDRACIAIEALMRIAYHVEPVDAEQLARDAISRISP